MYANCRITSSRLAFFMAICLTLGFVSACGTNTQKTESGNLTYAIENDIISLDPNKIIEIFSFQVMSEIFEGLIELDANNKVQPLIAESWTNSADFKTWRFKIRKGVRFHKDSCFGAAGTREVTAEDARYSFQRTLQKDAIQYFVLADVIAGGEDFHTGKAKSVSGLRVIDGQTLEIELTRPEPFFIYRIVSRWFSVVPKEACELGPDVFGRTKAVGTGPFTLQSRSDSEVLLTKNPDYWRTIPGNLKQVSFRVIKNEQIRLSEMINGHVAMTRVPLSAIPGVVKSADAQNVVLKEPFSSRCEVREFPTYNSHFLGFNCQKLDLHLRRAISFAINRQELIANVTHGTGILATGTVPNGLLGYKPPYSKDIFDLAKAKQELKLSKHDLAKPIVIVVHDQSSSEQSGQLIQHQLGQIGLKVELRKLAFNAAIDQIIKGDAEAFIAAFEYVVSAPEPILTDVFLSSKIPVPNLWHYRNPVIDKRLMQLLSTPGIERSNALAASIEKQVIDEAPAAFLFQLRNLVMYQKNLTDVKVNGNNVTLLWNVRVTDQ